MPDLTHEWKFCRAEMLSAPITVGGDELNDVVKRVVFCVIVSDGTNTYETDTWDMVLDDPADPQAFVPIGQVTAAQCIAWAETKAGASKIAEINAQADKAFNETIFSDLIPAPIE